MAYYEGLWLPSEQFESATSLMNIKCVKPDYPGVSLMGTVSSGIEPIELWGAMCSGIFPVASQTFHRRVRLSTKELKVMERFSKEVSETDFTSAPVAEMD